MAAAAWRRRGGGGSAVVVHSATAAGNGRGNSDDDERRDGDTTATTAMDSARAMAVNGETATQRQGNVQRRCNGDARPVVVTDIEIEEEEIVRE